MKAVVIGPAPPLRGGVAAHTAGLRRALESTGHRCAVLSFSRLYPRVLFPGRSQYAEGDDAGACASIDTIAPATWFAAARDLGRLRPDVVLVQWWHPATAPAVHTILASAKLEAPVVFVCHNARPHERSPGSAWLSRLALGRASAVLCHSRAVAERVAAAGVHPGAPLEVASMPLLIDPHRPVAVRETARDRLGIDRCTRLAVFAGHVRRYKGVDVLLQAWSRARLADDCVLMIAGEWYLRGRRRRRTLAAARSSTVRILDRYLDEDELVAVVAAADVLVLPYRSASQSGLAPLAAALGVPAVCTDAGGLPEQLAERARHRVGEPAPGLVLAGAEVPVRAGDAGRLAAALERALEGRAPAALRQERDDAFGAGPSSSTVMARSWSPTVLAVERLAARVAAGGAK